MVQFQTIRLGLLLNKLNTDSPYLTTAIGMGTPSLNDAVSEWKITWSFLAYSVSSPAVIKHNVNVSCNLQFTAGFPADFACRKPAEKIANGNHMTMGYCHNINEHFFQCHHKFKQLLNNAVIKPGVPLFLRTG